MSLDREEMARTSAEMRRHLDASGLGVEELGTWLGMSPAEVDGIIAMDGSRSPSEVWLVRDALESAVREQGADGGGWSVLTDAARSLARGWFVLRDLPTRPAARP